MHEDKSYQKYIQFISRPFTSKEELVKEFKKLYHDKSKAKELYQVIYSELKEAVSQGNIDNLKNLNNLINYICKSEDELVLRECYNSAKNPIKRTNLVILSCQHNKLNSLKYLFSGDCSILTDLSFHINKTVISPCDEDETCHNAFYYAIRSGNAELLNVLINEWPNNYFSTHAGILDTILSEAYEKLKLKNVPLSNEIEIYVENKLLDFRFFSDDSVKEQSFKYDISNIKGRIDLVLQAVDSLNIEYSDSEKVDGKYLFILKFIAQNIHILKRQLKSTYDRLPWEEIEFCLVCFVSSYIKRQDINLFYWSALDKYKIVNHLNNFTNALKVERDGLLESVNMKKLATLPNLQRDEVVHKVIGLYPQFELLYKDYQQIRDVYSLERINHYIDLAISADANEREGQLIITRALQVTGENIKNTLESPKLSNATSELLLLSLPKDTRRIVINLRNSLSHALSLSERTKIENNTDVNFFTGIQNDMKKIAEVISDILYSSKIKIIRMVLERIIISNTVNEVENTVKVLKNVDFTDLSTRDFKTTEFENLKKNIAELKKEIKYMTAFEKKLFNDIDEIVNFNEIKMEKNVEVYFTGYGSIKDISMLVNSSKIDSNSMREIKQFAGEKLEIIKPKLESHNLKKIAKLLRLIFSNVKSRIKNGDHNFDKVCKLLFESFFIVEFDINDIKWIEAFMGKLQIISKHKQKEAHMQIKEDYQNQLESKLSELKRILEKYALSDHLPILYPSYGSNQKLLAVIEMLVLDIMSILDTSENRLENNALYLNESTPVLTGKSLRNHLAHDNVLVDILFSNTNLAVILNAKKLTEGSVININRKLGKFIKDDAVNLKNKYNKSFTTISIQDNMFNAMEEGNITQLKTCMKNGADIYARDINLWNSLQLATKGPSLEVVKFILGHNFNLDIKDSDSQSLLHIATAYGRKNYIKLLLKNIDDSDDNGKTALHIAAQKGYTDIVEILLNSNADIDIQDMLGLLPVHYAVMNNNIDIVKILLEKEKCVDIEAMNGSTLLHLAAENGHLQLVDFLLENNADVYRRNEKQTVPLHLAALNGHVGIVNALLLKGAEVNAEAYDGCTPLHYAVETNRVNVVELLLKYRANSNAFDNAYYNRPLHFATVYGYKKIVTILLKHNAIANVTNAGGLTPLHIAVMGEFLNIVIDLVNYGVEIDSKDLQGRTPLHHAVKTDNKVITKFLIKNNANVNATTNYNFTALHIAADNGCYDVAKLLIKYHARINEKDTNGITPLHLAAFKGCEHIADLLMKNNANVNATTYEGMTPLHAAAMNGQENVFVLLLNNADISYTSADSLTLLHAAVMGCNKNIVDILINKGAEVNAKGIGDSTPLHVAVECQNKEIAELLIKNGADINIKFEDNLSLLSSAVKNNYKEIVELLLAKGANVNEEKDSLLFFAVYSGDKDIVEILLRNSPDIVDVKGSDNFVPLHVATRLGFTDIVNVLVNNRANINAVNNTETTSLYIAAGNGFEEIVKLLISNGADVNKGDEAGSPLHIAALRGHSNIVNILLSNKAVVNIKDAKNRTPLELAVARGHLNVVKKLLQSKKININHKGNDNYTVLHIASEQKTNLEMVKYLTNEGSDINAKNTLGFKPIHIAVEKGCIDIVEFFIKKGIKIEHHSTLLHYAVIKNQVKMVQYLIRQKADVNATDIIGQTPIHIAANLRYKLVVEILLNNGAIYNASNIKFSYRPLDVSTDNNIINLLKLTEKLFNAVQHNNTSEVREQIKAGACINAKNSENRALLHFAAWKGYDKIVNILLENQANPNVVDSDGFSPLHYAVKFSHFRAVMALLCHGAIYNAVSKNGETPLDFCKNKDITNLLHLVSESFTNVINNNCEVVSNINEIKDIEIVKAIMNAHNEHNNSLVASAICNNFSEVNKLKEVHQGHVSAQIDRALSFAIKGNYQQSLSILKIALFKRKKILGPGDLGTLDIQVHIAKVLYRQGIYQEALNIFEEVFEKQEKIFGPDNNYTLSTRSNIALIFHNQGRDKEAVNIYREVIPKQKEMLGPDDPDTLDSQFHMALSLTRLGKHEEALTINKIVFEKRKETLGENKGPTVSAENSIAMVLLNQKRNEEALQIFEDVLKKQEFMFGVKHSDTLETMVTIAKILFLQRRYNEALKAYKEVIPLQEEFLGRDHPQTLSCHYHMANVYFFQHKWGCAIKCYKEYFDNRDFIRASDRHIIKDISDKMNEMKLKYNLKDRELSNFLDKFEGNIHYAVNYSDVNRVQCILKNGANVNERDTNGMTPLHYAADRGLTDMVKVLLKNGAEITKVTNEGNTPLHLAVSKGHKKIIDVLLQHVSRNKLNKLLNARICSDETTALHVAAKNSYVDIVKCLLKYGANLSDRDINGMTPLHYAADRGLTDMVKVLLKNGADITKVTNEGNTPLHLAVSKGHLGIINIFIYHASRYSVNKFLNVRTKSDETTVLNLAAKNNSIGLVEHLLNYGADVNDRDTNGMTPIHYAADRGLTDMVKVLLKHGADITEATNEGNTPLHLAAANGHMEIIDILLQYVSHNELKEFLNARTCSDKITALHVATKNSYVDVVKCLLKYGATYNIKNRKGKTPADVTKHKMVKSLLKLIEDLFEDVKNGNLRFASKMQSVKPDELIALTNARNNEGITLLQVAINNNHVDIARKLVEFIKKADHK